MANRSLGVLTIDLVANTGGFTTGMDKSQRDLDSAIRKITSDLRTLAQEQGMSFEAAAEKANIVSRSSKQAAAAINEMASAQKASGSALTGANYQLSKAGDLFNQVGGKTRLAQHELMNFSYQIQDIGIGLASGQKPLTVLIQQGSQIAQIYAASGVSIKSMILSFAELVGRFTPVIAVVGAGITTFSAFKSAMQIDSAPYVNALDSMGVATDAYKKKLEELGGETVTYMDILRGISGQFINVEAAKTNADGFFKWFATSIKQSALGFVGLMKALDADARAASHGASFAERKKIFLDAFNEAVTGVEEEAQKRAKSAQDKAYRDVLRSEAIKQAGVVDNILQSTLTGYEKIASERRKSLMEIDKLYRLRAASEKILDPVAQQEKEAAIAAVNKKYNEDVLKLKDQQAKAASRASKEQIQFNNKLAEARKEMGRLFDQDDPLTKLFNTAQDKIQSIQKLLTPDEKGRILIDPKLASANMQRVYEEYKTEFARLMSDSAAQAEAAAREVQERINVARIDLYTRGGSVLPPSGPVHSVIQPIPDALIRDYNDLFKASRTDAEKTAAALRSQMLTLELMASKNPARKEEADDIAKRLRQLANPYYEQGLGASVKLTNQQEKLKEAFDEGWISLNQYNQGLRDLEAQQLQLIALRGKKDDGSDITGLEAFSSGLELYANQFKGTFAELQGIGLNFTQSLANGAGDAFASMIVDGKSFKDEIGNLSRGVIRELISGLASAAIQAAIFRAVITGSSFGLGAASTTTLPASLPIAASGGFIVGSGSNTSDSIALRVSNGESVINAEATARNARVIQAMNAGADITPKSSGVQIINNAPGVAIDRQTLSNGDIRLIVRQEMAQNTDKYTAAALEKQYSRSRSAMLRTTKTARKL